ncbi:MAG: hypothetical protein M3410_00475 [Acidobacteriota bacterium]|nr:hypothetical protein [Acidobacteriota bacterium]
MTPVVLIADTIVIAIMSSVQSVVYTIVAAAGTIIPVSSRPFAVPAAVAGIMAIYELATLTVAPVAVTTLPLVALISESCPR